MTDRYSALTVILEKPMRDDDAQELIAAIRMFRNVGRVVPHVQESSEIMAEYRAKHELQQKLWDVLK